MPRESCLRFLIRSGGGGRWQRALQFVPHFRFEGSLFVGAAPNLFSDVSEISHLPVAIQCCSRYNSHCKQRLVSLNSVDQLSVSRKQRYKCLSIQLLVSGLLIPFHGPLCEDLPRNGNTKEFTIRLNAVVTYDVWGTIVLQTILFTRSCFTNMALMRHLFVLQQRD